MTAWLWRRAEQRLKRVVPESSRASVLGDLCEEYETQRKIRGAIRSTAWLLSEVRSLERSYRGDEERSREMLRAFADWRVAARSLMRRPGFSAAAIFMLSVGLGAGAASWSIYDAVLVRPLAYPAADRLLYLSCLLPGENEPGASMSFQDARDVAERASSLDAVAAFWDTPALQTNTPSGPAAVFANFVQGSYFDILGARPSRGRLIDANDNLAPGQHPVAVISDAFWRARLNASESVVGSTLPLNGRPFTIIGVVAPDFRDVPFENGEQPSGGHPTDIWLPGSMLELGFNGPAAVSRSARLGNAVGRLKPAVSVEQAREELKSIAETLGREFPATNQRIGFWADPLAHHLYKPIRRPLGVVLSASIVLLMIGALNVGGLLLVRQQERRRELVVRRALGASVARLLGVSALESALLVGAALVIAGPIAAGILGVIRRTAPIAFPRLQSATFDLTAAGALAVLGAVATILVALVSMTVVWRLGADAKPSTTRSVTADRASVRLQRLMVIGEVALSAALLVCSSLVVASLVRLNVADAGFDSERLIAMELSLRSDRYRDDAAVTAFSQTVMEQASSVPGAESVALWGPGRPGRDTWITFPVPEKDAPNPDPDRVMVWRHNITPGALKAVGIPLIRGREFLATDAATRPYVAVISETMAKRFWGEKNPIGERFTVASTNPARPWFQVIGVARDASHRGRLNSLTIPQLDVYQLLDQRVERALTLVVRSAGSTDSVIPEMREVIRRIDPNLALRNITTLDQHLRAEGAALRFASLLLASYAGLAFLLSAFGVYALISYVVTTRSREWAMRQVLGATPSSLFRRLVSGGAAMAAAGVAIGLVAAWWSAALLESVLFGVSARSGAAYVVVGALVLGGTIAAAAIPARRVGRIEPASVLQSE